jgi:hypothetical protein
LVQEIEVFGQALRRSPWHTFVQGSAGYVFDTFHTFDERLLFTSRARCETGAAVAHHQRCHAIAESWVELLGPRGLTVGGARYRAGAIDNGVSLDHNVMFGR